MNVVSQSYIFEVVYWCLGDFFDWAGKVWVDPGYNKCLHQVVKVTLHSIVVDIQFVCYRRYVGNVTNG